MAANNNAETTTPSKGNSVSGLAKGYLVAYNVILSSGWGMILLKTLQYMLDNEGEYGIWKGVPGLHFVIKDQLRLFQTLACMEVVHCIIGIVSSSALLTFLQVLSRVFVLWGLIEGVAGVNDSVGLMVVLLAWSITEVIRYAFYACTLIGNTPRMLTYMRYTLFYVLYPTGVTGEQILFFTALPVVRATQQWSISLPNPLNFAFSYYYFLIFGAFIYIPLFPQLYGHMISQRKKVLSKVKAE
ncbi:PREDICTED: very-long-chain (3R)-3-hydroxyacyl-CoA dehydratase 2-like [Amphimedon queenslandica]|uniref:Very-long-chain (3R)-3-hydroxyacyl-CoA dehydratase n=1 Tax=Amphimedon queenslandica TaxID=400682 RepID=A0A1X7UYL1_AMPQE|nr:PREDICTED: very-long-chain (3R)-3-hydroxyacyl-CoA dehydratase 2-like [Amphimedon queenslandica]|eukprot:XP_003386467.1 PREDICTED: very-long-chain (3R)-3-hydroxyacyl-CoA dehydratase 2-like [Amphimedon queenslandica]